MKTFIINGKVYTAKEFDFNMICDLEDDGVSLEFMEEKPVSMMRAYFRICAGMDIISAGLEMQKHIISGGNLDSLSEAISDAMENSDFFRHLKAETEKDSAENQGETTAETE